MSLAPTFLCQLSQRPLPDSGREGCFVKNLRPWGYHVPSLWEKKLGLLVLRPALGWAWEAEMGPWALGGEKDLGVGTTRLPPPTQVQSGAQPLLALRTSCPPTDLPASEVDGP